MTNPIMEMLNQQGVVPQQSQFSQPQGLPTSLDDPRMSEVKEYVKENGGDPKAAFYKLCQERMLNPAEIINKLTGR